MYEVNAKLLQEYGSYTKKGKIFNRNGTEVPYFILNVHFGEILLFENKKKVKIEDKHNQRQLHQRCPKRTALHCRLSCSVCIINKQHCFLPAQCGRRR